MIPGLTTSERAELNGLSFREQVALEQRERWVATWPARHGGGQAKLRAYLAYGRPKANRSELCVMGDRAIVDSVRGVVDALPEAIAHHVVGNVVIVCGGVETRGWWGRMPILPCAAPELISVSVADPAIVAHEVAHSWQALPSPRTRADRGEALREHVCALALEDGTAAELVDGSLEKERAADALVRALGWSIDTTSGDGRRRRLMQALERDAAAHRDREQRHG